MSDVINVAEAKAHFSQLLDRAAAGEEIVIARSGRPVARLMPLAERPRRRFGSAKDWPVKGEWFLEPMDEEDLRAAEGIDTDEFGITRKQ